jgi:hypothetical protein
MLHLSFIFYVCKKKGDTPKNIYKKSQNEKKKTWTRKKSHGQHSLTDATEKNMTQAEMTKKRTGESGWPSH